MKSTKNDRLLSLDVLRGADLMLLLAVQPVLWHWLPMVDAPWSRFLMDQLTHCTWEGFRLEDLIMPLFLFMAGASMPFSFSKYENRPQKELWIKIIRRTLILFVLGMVVQGNLLTLDPHRFTLYVNTLQSIGIGYLVSSILQLTLRPKAQIGATLALLLVYWIPMTFCGDWTVEGNFAYKVDEVLMGSWRGDLAYTWIWSSLTFAVSVQLGAFAGMIVRNTNVTPRNRFLQLLAIGVALCIASWLWSFQMPIIKHIWTCSMTLLAAGYSFLLLALFYGWIDVLGHRKGWLWFKVFGVNSIVAYMLGELVNFRSIGESLLYGLQPLLGEGYPVLITLSNSLVLCGILYAMYKAKIFLKI